MKIESYPRHEKFECYHCGHIWNQLYIPFKSDIYCPSCLRGVVTQ